MPVRRSQNWLPSIFNDFFDNEWMVKANATAPAINVIETEKAYKVELAAPGMTKEDFNVRIDEENNLVISMEKKTENKDHISAQVENGVLNIELPKLSEEEVKKPDRTIEVK